MPSGSHYRAARLRDPDLIEAMVRQPDGRPTAPRLEDYDSLRADMADIKDLLWRVMFVAGHNDPKNAPTTPRPEMPWEGRRRELSAAKGRAIRAILMPWETD